MENQASKISRAVSPEVALKLEHITFASSHFLASLAVSASHQRAALIHLTLFAAM